MNSIVLAVRVDRADIALQLVEGIGRFLAFRHRHQEWSIVLNHVLSKVDQSSLERQRLGQLLTSLGRANWASGCYPDALDAIRRAIEIFRTGDDQHSLARALMDRGNVFERLGEYDDARVSFDEAANVLQAIGHWQHACTAWEGVAIQLVHAGQFEEAVDAFRTASP